MCPPPILTANSYVNTSSPQEEAMDVIGYNVHDGLWTKLYGMFKDQLWLTLYY